MSQLLSLQKKLHFRPFTVITFSLLDVCQIDWRDKKREREKERKKERKKEKEEGEQKTQSIPYVENLLTNY